MRKLNDDEKRKKVVGVRMTIDEYQKIATDAEAAGQTGSGFVAVASLFFAVGAAVGWSFYGKRASEYLGLPTKIYAVIFCVITAVGATLPEMQLFEIADLFNAMMMLPNLCVLICCANQVSLIAKRLK